MIELAENRKLNISNIQIHKRTFEGKVDDSKNDNAVTSKYYTSRKYAVTYNIEGYAHNPVVDCVITKKDAKKLIKKLVSTHNVD